MIPPSAPKPNSPVLSMWGKNVSDGIRANRVRAVGPGLRLESSPEGFVISLNHQRESGIEENYDQPFSFSLETDSEGAKRIKISDCVYSAGGKIIDGDSDLTISLPSEEKFLFAMLSTSNLTLEFLAWSQENSNDPDTQGDAYFPIPLYRVNSSGAVTLDMRGSALPIIR